MPIRGLTRRGTRSELPQLGKLRKGGPKGERTPGKDLDYFRFTSDRTEVEAAFTEAFGEKPVAIRAFLMAPTAAEAFDPWQERWGGDRLLHRCDGKFCVLWFDEKSGAMQSDPDMLTERPCPGGCSPVGRLALAIPALWEAGYVGIVTLETHSKYDIVHIGAMLQEVERRARGESLQGIEFVIRREAMQIRVPKKGGGSMRTNKNLVRIEPASAWMLANLKADKLVALGQEPERAVMVVDGETGEVLEDVASEADVPWDTDDDDVGASDESEASDDTMDADGTEPLETGSAPDMSAYDGWVEKAAGRQRMIDWTEHLGMDKADVKEALSIDKSWHEIGKAGKRLSFDTAAEKVFALGKTKGAIQPAELFAAWMADFNSGQD